MPSARARPRHPHGQLPWAGHQQARAPPSRRTKAWRLHPELDPGFSSSWCPPLRWQHGVTLGTHAFWSDANLAAGRAPPPGPNHLPNW